MTTVKQQWEAAGGLMIGPSFLGAGALHTSSTVSNSDGSQTLTTQSRTTTRTWRVTDRSPFYTGD